MANIIDEAEIVRCVLKRNAEFCLVGNSSNARIFNYIKSIKEELNLQIYNRSICTAVLGYWKMICGLTLLCLGLLLVVTMALQVIYIYGPLFGDDLAIGVVSSVVVGIFFVTIGIIFMGQGCNGSKQAQIIPKCKRILDAYLEKNSHTINSILIEDNWSFSWRFEETSEINRTIRFVHSRNNILQKTLYWTTGEIVFTHTTAPQDVHPRSVPTQLNNIPSICLTAKGEPINPQSKQYFNISYRSIYPTKQPYC